MDTQMGCNRILLLEDDEPIRYAVKESLEFEGYTVLTAENGKEGLELLGSNYLPQLILLDLMMPVMNGFEFLDAIRKDKHYSCIPVVVISAFPEKAQTMKADGFVKKPINLDRLLEYAKQYCR